MAANTPTTYYFDSQSRRTPCQLNYNKIREKCGPDDQSSEKGKKKKVKPSIKDLLGKQKYKEKGYDKTLSRGGTDNTSWMADNCDFLWIPPGPDSHDKFIQQLDALKGDLSEAVEGALKNILDEAKDKIRAEAIERAQKMAGQAAVRAGGRWVVGAGAMLST